MMGSAPDGLPSPAPMVGGGASSAFPDDGIDNTRGEKSLQYSVDYPIGPNVTSQGIPILDAPTACRVVWPNTDAGRAAATRDRKAEHESWCKRYRTERWSDSKYDVNFKYVSQEGLVSMVAPWGMGTDGEVKRCTSMNIDVCHFLRHEQPWYRDCNARFSFARLKNHMIFKYRKKMESNRKAVIGFTKLKPGNPMRWRRARNI